MSIQSDKIRAAVILDRVKGCKVEDNEGNQYSIFDVKVFNGLVSTIGLKDVPTGFIKYASFDAYMEMASVAWLSCFININLHNIQPMNTISADYKATLRSKIAVRADELFPGDSMDAVKERMTFTRKMYNMIMEEKNIDLFWLVPLH